LGACSKLTCWQCPLSFANFFFLPFFFLFLPEHKQRHAYIGDAATVVTLITHGYRVDGRAKGDDTFRPLPSLLVRRGELTKAWELVHADAALGLQVCSLRINCTK